MVALRLDCSPATATCAADHASDPRADPAALLTARCVVDKVKEDRLRAQMIEAAEQCGGTFVPEVADLQHLDKLLDTWPGDRRILWCDETKVGAQVALSGATSGPWAILIGPEGGFSDTEQKRLRAMPQVLPVSLGPRILRADTAAVAALTACFTARPPSCASRVIASTKSASRRASPLTTASIR